MFNLSTTPLHKINQPKKSLSDPKALLVYYTKVQRTITRMIIPII